MAIFSLRQNGAGGDRLEKARERKRERKREKTREKTHRLSIKEARRGDIQRQKQNTDSRTPSKLKQDRMSKVIIASGVVKCQKYSSRNTQCNRIRLQHTVTKSIKAR